MKDDFVSELCIEFEFGFVYYLFCANEVQIELIESYIEFEKWFFGIFLVLVCFVVCYCFAWSDTLMPKKGV